MAVVPSLHFLRAPVRNEQQALARVGLATLATVIAGVSAPPADGHTTYLAAALFGGLATIRAAFWVADGVPRRRTTGQLLLCISLVPLVGAAVVTGHYEFLAAVSCAVPYFPPDMI